MKAAFLIDFTTAKRVLGKYLLITAVCIAVCVLVLGPFPWVTLYTGFLVSVGATQILLITDDRRRWLGFRLALPLSHRDVVLGRYAFLAAVVALGVALGLAICALDALVLHSVPSLAAAARYPTSFEGPAIVLATSVTFAVVFLMMGTVYPLSMRFGYTRALQYLLALFMLVLSLAPFVFGPGSELAAFAFVRDAAAHLLTPPTAYVVAGLLFVAACAFFAGSAWLTHRLCVKRDF